VPRAERHGALCDRLVSDGGASMPLNVSTMDRVRSDGTLQCVCCDAFILDGVRCIQKERSGVIVFICLQCWER
jgi:hypothetical protein